MYLKNLGLDLSSVESEVQNLIDTFYRYMAVI